MTYSAIVILAIAVLFITNWDIIWKRGKNDLTPTHLRYRSFLFGILFFYIMDALWGILDALRVGIVWMFAETSIYFVAMATALLLWTNYVTAYLEKENAFARALYLAGRIFFVLQLLAIAVNLFYPLLFWFDEDGGYHAGFARYATLAVQIMLFFLTAVYTLRVAHASEDRERSRHLTVGAFGIVMVILIAVQLAYPLLPLYTVGLMLGSCLFHSFVVEGEKEEYRQELEKSLEREQLQTQELRDSRETLKCALAAADEANRAKTVFLSNMSHEIRTPMNAIIGLNSIALKEPTASEPVKEYLLKIDDSARYLLSIINEILDMSRIESGSMVIRNEEFSLTKCLEQVKTIIGGQCREKGLTFDCRTQGSIDELYIGDAIKLKQILVNILGNAVKFTPTGGTVSFMIEEGSRYDGQATLRFIIQDNGIGMSKEFLPHLFESFSQENNPSAGGYESTGLGMPITKSLVELMNGHIEVESEKNVGTKFTVTVTLGESKQKDVQSQDIEADQSRELASTISEEPQERRADLKGRHILIAEDVEVNAEIMVAILGMREMEADIAENGRVALKMFNEHPEGYYDAILMDMRMPEMDGLEATAAIRASDRADAKTIPIIALTANAFDEDVRRSLQAGLNAHQSKPVDPDVLFDTMEQLIR